MKRYIYCVRLHNGRAHPEFGDFYVNMTNELKAVPHTHGSMDGALVSHTQDLRTVQLLASYQMNQRGDVTVEEVTKETLRTDIHVGYKQLVKQIMGKDKKSYPNL